MDITEISEENLDEFKGILDPDIVENIARKYFKGIVALSDGEVQGAMIWELLYVDDIYHSTEARINLFHITNREAGNALLENYSDRCFDDEVEKSHFQLPKSQDGLAEEILKENGFDLREGEGSYLEERIKQLSQLSLTKKKNIPSYIVALGELSSRTYRRGIVDCLFHIQRELLDDLDELPIEWFEPNISCYEETDGDVSGYLLLHKNSSGAIRVELLADWGPDSNIMLLNMIRFAIKKGIENYSDDTKVLIHRHDESTINLTKYLFPNEKGPDRIIGERSEE